MTDANQQRGSTPGTPEDNIAARVPDVINARQEIVEVEHKNLIERQEAGITPFHVPQATFPEVIKQGIHGMVNRMVDFNTVTKSVEAPAAGMAAGRAVSQSAAYDINCVLGGTLKDVIGITILDPTNIAFIGSTVPVDATPQYFNIGVLTKGELFITASVITVAGDPVHFGAADGILTNVGGVGPIVGARWKYSRPANELNVVQLGIQR
jgi:hypothetical protein